MTEELVSVIIPTYNREKTILRAIKSVLNQTYKNMEIIIVDDNSTDNTENKVRELNDDRIVYIRNTKNMGATVSRNIGIKNSHGTVIAFQDSDDEWKYDKIEKQMKVITKEENVAMVYCSYIYHESNSTRKIPECSHNLEKLSGNIFNELLKGNKIGTPTIIVKRDVLNKVGLFSEDIRALEDWELSLRISKEYRIEFVNESLVDAYRVGTGVNGHAEHIIEAIMYIYDKYGKYDTQNYFYDNLQYALKLIEESGKREIYKSIVVPNIIRGNLEYDLIMDAMKKVRKFQTNYNLLVKIASTNTAIEIFEDKLHINSSQYIAIYGAGHVGRVVYNILKNANYRNVILIDNNVIKIDENLNVIKKEEIPSEVDLIIVSVVNLYNEIEEELKKYSNAKAVSICDICM